MVFGLVKAMVAPGEAPPSVKHPREMMSGHSRMAQWRLYPVRYLFRNDLFFRRATYAAMFVGGFFVYYYLPFFASPRYIIEHNRELKEYWAHEDHHHKHIVQRDADRRYFALNGDPLPKKL